MVLIAAQQQIQTVSKTYSHNLQKHGDGFTGGAFGHLRKFVAGEQENVPALLQEVSGKRGVVPVKSWLLQKKIEKKGTAVVVALSCAAVLCFSALADDGPHSNVWLTVVEVKSDARISVTVPVSYGFVVVGSVDTADNGRISVEDGNLRLPNASVSILTPSNPLPGASGNAVYSIDETSAGNNVPIRNYSTDVREENLGVANPPREGLPVKLKAYIHEEEQAEIGGVALTHYWKPIATAPTTSAADFKKFRLGADGKYFSVPGVVYLPLLAGGGMGSLDVLWLDGEIDLAAPPNVLVDGYTAAGLANIPSTLYVPLTVDVGGVQNQYKQVEESVKVTQITWTVVPGTLPAPPTP